MQIKMGLMAIAAVSSLVLISCNGGIFDGTNKQKGRNQGGRSAGYGNNGDGSSLNPDGTTGWQGGTGTQLEGVCRRKMESGDVIKVVGNSGKVDLTAGAEVTAIVVAGNSQEADIELSAEGKIGKLCVIVVGNSNTFRLRTKLAIDQVYYRSAGNANESELEIAAGGSVGEFEVTHVGNADSLVIKGEGQYKCPSSPVIAGNAMEMSCK
jgi:hypothetical protein